MAPIGTKVLYSTTNLEEFFKPARAGELRLDVESINKNVSIRRMQCFAIKGTECVSCHHAHGNTIRVEEWPNGQIHVDLYDVREDGSFVLINIDHIKPKSLGGGNTLSNYQPMCQPCNTRKGNNPKFVFTIKKGDKGGECNRKACRNPAATWYNRSTEKYYCKPCAMRIMSYPESAGLLTDTAETQLI